jgi:hypothetical protein
MWWRHDFAAKLWANSATRDLTSFLRDAEAKLRQERSQPRLGF